MSLLFSSLELGCPWRGITVREVAYNLCVLEKVLMWNHKG